MELLHSGKVRDVYADGADLILVASDRVSVYDVVLPTPIPDKGAILTSLSLWWFEQLADVLPNHVISATDVPAHWAGRAIRCRRLDMVPVECIARGYLTGSGLVEYRQTGRVCGVALPAGLGESDALPEPIFTPTTKAPVGVHDQPMTFDDVMAQEGAAAAEDLRAITLEVYRRGRAIAAQRGIIIADTKIELGRTATGELVLADEVLTPDSSRFWPAAEYEPGRVQRSFDKQYVRDWAAGTGWDKTAPGPAIPDEVVAVTRARYVEAYERLTRDILERLMYAVTIPQYGSAEVLTWAEVPDPQPGPDDVLIDVVASAVNRADLLQRSGFYPPPAGASSLPGLECSGRISALGVDVAGWRVGDEVCALLTGGGYAQRVVVPAGQVAPVPTGVSVEDAAALPEAICTVWSNVFDIARLGSLDTILIHGGGGGIGTAAIQLAAAHGARVLTTARASKHDQLRGLGAQVTIDYETEDFVEATRTATAGHGADVILDNMGASYVERNVATLAVGGRLMVIGLQGGRTGPVDLGALLTKRASITATSLRPRPAAEKAQIVAAVRDRVWPLFGAGELRPVVHARLPMAEAAAAHRMLESSVHVGKVLLLAP